MANGANLLLVEHGFHCTSVIGHRSGGYCQTLHRSSTQLRHARATGTALLGTTGDVRRNLKCQPAHGHQAETNQWLIRTATARQRVAVAEYRRPSSLSSPGALPRLRLRLIRHPRTQADFDHGNGSCQGRVSFGGGLLMKVAKLGPRPSIQEERL